MPVTIGRLSAADDLGSFDCGDAELNRYLLEDSKNNQAIHSVGVTYIARDTDVSSTILGYHTLAVGHLPKDRIQHILGPAAPPYPLVPYVLLARLAVQNAVHKRGIGGMLLKHAFDVVLTVKASVGCRLMVVDAYVSAVKFYEQFGFISLPSQAKTTKMFIDLLTIEKTVSGEE